MNFFDAYGDAGPSSVANSQIHYGQVVPIKIEDQPLARGSVLWDVTSASATANAIRLLVQDYDKNDFGDTHSIVLIADSLRVQSVYANLDAAATLSQFGHLMGLASNSKSDTPYLSGIFTGSQGKAEGDMVESFLDAGRFVFLGPGTQPLLDKANLQKALTGGTWADVQTLRPLLEGGVLALAEATSSLKGKLKISLSSSAMDARSDFSAFASLYGLSTLYFAGVDASAQSSLETQLGTQWGSIYDAWKADRALGSSPLLASFTDSWMRSRSNMLQELIWRNARKTQDDETTLSSLLGYAVTFVDKALGRTFNSGWTLPGRDRAQIVFGSKIDEQIAGGARSDSLYGGDGDDDVRGKDGDDWLEGNAGDDQLDGGADDDTLLGGTGDDTVLGRTGTDSLIGGSGDDTLNGGTNNDTLSGGDDNDTYVFDAAWGVDTVRDSDGVGKLSVAGYESGLPVGKQMAPGADVYVSADKRVTYTLGPVGPNGLRTVTITFKDATGQDASDRIVIEGWSEAKNLGITLDTTTTPAVADRVVIGDYAKLKSDVGYGLANVWDQSAWRPSDGYSYRPAGAEPNAADVINGFSGAADSIMGLGGNDALNGNDGDDVIDGGDGGDLLLGGLGADSILGGDGSDIIVGSNYEPLRTPLTPEQFAAVNLNVPAGGTLFSQGFTWVAYTITAPGSTANLFKVVGDGITWRVTNEENLNLELNTSGKGNFIDAGAGDDRVLAGGGRDVALGGDGNDTLEGLWDADYLEGGDGDDLIKGDGSTSEYIGDTGLTNSAWSPPNLHGNDSLLGGFGEDILIGQGGDDVLFGGVGNDSLWGDEADLNVEPGSLQGDDYLDGGDGNDHLIGGGGKDQLLGGEGNDLLVGDSDRPDLPLNQHGDDTLDGGAGADYAEGAGGADLVLGGAGNDTLWGDAITSKVDSSVHGDDTLDGGEGDDAIYGGGGADIILGGAGNDSITGDGPADDGIPAAQVGADWIDAAAGNDVVEAGGGDDTVLGAEGDDSLYGQDGNDLVDGGSGSDRVDGGAGNDTLIGGGGTDALIGGDGDDTYVFSAGDSPLNAAGAADSIEDTVGSNRLVFTGVNLGSLVVQAYSDGVVQIQLSSTQTVMLTAGTAATISSFDFGRVRPSTTPTTPASTTAGSLASIAEGADVSVAAESTLAASGQRTAQVTATRSIASTSVLSADDGGFSLSELIGTFSATSSYLTGEGGTALAFGGKGNDTLTVGTRDAQVSGGLGDDTVTITRAGFTYAYRLGDGFDRIKAKASRPAGNSPAPQDRNSIAFGWGISANDIVLSVSGSNLVLSLDAYGSGLNIDGFIASNVLAGSSIDDFRFSDGTSLTYAQLVARGFTVNGTDANESLSGTSVTDRFVASAGNDTMAGGAGSDVYEWGESSGLDVVQDGVLSATDVDVLRLVDGLTAVDLRFIRVGNDLFVQRKDTNAYLLVTDQFVGKGVEQIQFADGLTWDVSALQANLVSYGTPFNDELLGDGQPNLLEGFAGADTLRGGAGDDTLIGGQGDDSLLGGAGNDRYRFVDGDGSNGSTSTLEVLDDSEGLQTLEFVGVAADAIHGSAFSDGRWQLRYGTGSTVTLTKSSVPAVTSIIVQGQAISVPDFVAKYSNSLSYIDTSGKTVVLGGSESSGFTITASDTQVNVGSGSMYLANQSTGGLNVTWKLGAGTLTVDRMTNAGSGAVLKFGPGITTSNVQFANFGDTLTTSLVVNGQAALRVTDEQLLAANSTPPFDFFEFADGTRLTWAALRALNPRINVLAPDWMTTATGTTLDDVAVGNAIARTWELGAGNDLAVLGASNDTFNMGTGSDEVSVASGFGQDTVSFVDTVAGDVIRFAAGISSTNIAYGRNDVDLNVLIKGTNDKLTIKDFFVYANASDVRLADLKFQFSNGDFSLGRSLVLSPLSELVTAADDVLWGGDGADYVDAGAGNDSLMGLGGNDTLIGGVGNDTLEGGWGNDSLVGGAGNDVIVAIFDADTVIGGLGDDRIGGISTTTYRYDAGDGNDTIQGGGKLILGAGLDPQDVIFTKVDVESRQSLKIEFQSKGGSVVLVDPLVYSPYQVVFQSGEIWNQTYLVNAFTGILGTSGADALMGTSGADRIRGQQGNDTLTGLAGADELDGGSGADSMIGGADNDTYWVDNVGDVVVENVGEGVKDMVKTYIDYALPANVEDGTLLGTAHLSLTGNALSNVLTGNGGNNIINGGAGQDTLIGGAGDDTYVVDVVGDVVTEAASAGTDLVQSSVAWTLGANLENLTLLGTAAIDGTGNSLANVIRGNATNNRIDGGAGVDTLLGAGGDDTYVVRPAKSNSTRFADGTATASGHDGRSSDWRD